MTQRLISAIEGVLFNYRKLILVALALVTVFLGWSATHLQVDAGFDKLLPLKHKYMEAFVEYRDDFGGANRVIVSLVADEGDMFTPTFFTKLKKVTDEVFFIPGVNRAQVTSLFTPNVRYIEVVEDGFAGGNVVPASFKPEPADIEQVRQNILKAGIVGRLVANDFSGAIVSATLLEVDPNTGEKLDIKKVAAQLEDIRQQYAGEGISIQVIGFAKAVGDIAAGAKGVIMFFGIAFLITAVLVYLYSRNALLTVAPLLTSLVAVVWQLGLLRLFGFGIDPMSILVPFLVFAIAVSHGVQMVNATKQGLMKQIPVEQSARASFRRLLVPGGVALLSDTIGFLTILFIEIRIIQELAITASLGVGVIIITNLIVLPLLIASLPIGPMQQRSGGLTWLWPILIRLTQKPVAAVVILLAIGLAAAGSHKATQMKVGDLHQGVPELREDSRYNLDTAVITDKFSIGVDILTVIAETEKDGCVNYDVMHAIDQLEWQLSNIDGVQSAVSLASVAKKINAGYNEGLPKWQILPRNTPALAQTMTYIETSSGLLNRDCDAIPVYMFTEDHKAETLDHILVETKKAMAAIERPESICLDSKQQEVACNTLDDYRVDDVVTPKVVFRLATGNVGVMAATNEAVREAQLPMLFYVYAAVIALCLITFRSLRGTLCVVLPLALVSILANALMAYLEIGLKVSTLPVVALGVGIGVDYGIYIFSCMQNYLRQGKSVAESYAAALGDTGNAVLFTGFTLAIGVSTWIFSALKFQADMGVLLTFMFLVNMLAAIILMPALASFLYKPKPKA